MNRIQRRLALAVFALTCLIGAGGCGRPAAAIHLAGTGSRTVGPTCVTYVDQGHGLALAVWCNWHGGSSGSVRGVANAAEYTGEVKGDTGQRVSWKWVTSDNASGSLVLNGTDYDVARGRLFLVSTKSGKTEVRQLQRDLAGVQPDGLQRWADSDPDVSKFIAQAPSP
jgi:hypothetical protein